MKHAKIMRKLVLLVTAALLAAVLVCFAVWLLLFRETEVRSLSAHVAGAPVEIKALTDGQVQFIAAYGSRVKKGDLLLKIKIGDPLASGAADLTGPTDTTNSAEAPGTTGSANAPTLRERLETLDPQVALVLSGFMSIPESLPQLAAQLEEQFKATKQADEAVIAQSVSHAQVQLELRKLELKKGRIAEDETRLQELRRQDENEAALLAQSRERRDELNNARAGLEKRLRTRKMLEAAFASLGEDQQSAFYQAREDLGRLQEVEKELARSSVSAPNDGLVIKTLLKQDEEAQFGQLALLLAPDQGEAFWVSAVFAANAAEKIEVGSACLVEFSAGENFSLPGRVGEKQPTTADEQAAGQTRFRIILQTEDPAQLARLYERQPATVALQ